MECIRLLLGDIDEVIGRSIGINSALANRLVFIDEFMMLFFWDRCRVFIFEVVPDCCFLFNQTFFKFLTFKLLYFQKFIGFPSNPIYFFLHEAQFVLDSLILLREFLVFFSELVVFFSVIF